MLDRSSRPVPGSSLTSASSRNGFRNSENNASGKHRKSLFASFLSYYAPQKHLFILDTICAIILACIELAFPQILRSLTKGLFVQGKDAILGSLVFIAVGLVVMYFVHFLCRYFVISWGHIMGARMESKMREDLFDAYERMSFSYYDRHKTGDLMSRLVSDLFDISETAHHGPEYLIIGLLEIAGSFVILTFINVPLTLVLAGIAAALVVFNFFANMHMRGIFKENRMRISDVNTQLEDSLSGIRVVKGFAAEDHERKKFRASNSAYLDSKANMYQAMGRYQAAISGMMGVLNTVVLVLGGWMIAQGQMQAIDLATYALYISLFTTPIMNILNFTETFQKGLAGFKRFSEILETQPDIQDAPDAHDIQITAGDIIYQDVHFSYNNAEDVINGLNLHIESGKLLRWLDLQVEASPLPALYCHAFMMLQAEASPLTDRTFAPLRSTVCARQLVWSSRTCISLTAPLRRTLHTVAPRLPQPTLRLPQSAQTSPSLSSRCLTDMTRRLDSVEQGFPVDRSSAFPLRACSSRTLRCSFWMRLLLLWITSPSVRYRNPFLNWQRIGPRWSLPIDFRQLWAQMRLLLSTTVVQLSAEPTMSC